VLAPTSVADSFDVTVAAFNLAERYQTPVIILSDQEIAQRKETVDPIDVSKFEIEERRRPTEAELDAGYRRFAITPSGVSPISHPGMAKGAYLGSGIEHAEDGSPTANGVVHAMMNEKRLRKLDPLHRATDLVRIEGDADAPLALVSWGSSAGVCLEALQQCRMRGTPAKLFIPYLVYPVNEELMKRFFASVKRGLVVEQSHLGQFYRLIRMFVDVPSGVRSLCRSGANPFQPSEIVSHLIEARP
jgi:2-oxoglutarate/2-oxoacid ferredoxin oxidoreductase subunit alpha